jgi:hypothetical protein
LFSASSRTVHFSVGEALRNTWWDPAKPNQLFSRGRQHHEYAFALDTLIQIAMRTLAHSFKLVEGTGTAKVDLRMEHLEPVVTRLSQLGRVPMIIPEEFNLGPLQARAQVTLKWPSET